MHLGSGNSGRDAALAIRRLAHTPLFVLTVIGTLGVGLGAFAVVYTAVDKILIEPLPYERPDDLYFVWRDYGPIFDLNRGWLSGPDIAAVESAGGAIEAVVGLRRTLMTLSGGSAGEAEEIGVQRASPGLFELLGVAPALGRTFAPDEVGPGRPPLVVLSDALWRRRFGADPSIPGAEIRLDGSPFTVIGVMGPDFEFVQHASLGEQEGSDAYITFDFDLAEQSPTVGSFAALMRAAPGTQPARLEAAVAAVGESIDRRIFQDRGLRLYPTGLKADLVSTVRPALVVLGLAGLFLLLVILLNLATLLLARAAQREQEFAISRALGANRVALARGTILEAIVLGGLGGLVGAIIAIWGVGALIRLAPLDLPRAGSVAVDWPIAAVVVFVGALMGLAAGAAPAVWATRTEVLTLLARTSERSGGGHGRLRRGMVVLQVALSLVLLSAAGLVARSFGRLLRSDPGFEAANVLVFRVAAPPVQYPDDDAIVSLHERTESALAAIPGVTAVGATSSYPLSDETDQTLAGFPAAPGNSGDPDADQPLVDYFGVRPGYPQAMRIPVLAGRTFDPSPAPGAREVVVDRTLAERFFPDGNAVGATLLFSGDSMTVIGVVGHARQYSVHRDGRPQVYLPTGLRPVLSMSWAVRSDRSFTDLIPDSRWPTCSRSNA
jgi:predicted permease